MDKTLEIIMVAVALVVAAVIVTSFLQGRVGDMAQFSDTQTNSSSCGLAEQRIAGALDCSKDSSNLDAAGIAAYENNKNQCGWTGSSNLAAKVCNK